MHNKIVSLFLCSLLLSSDGRGGIENVVLTADEVQQVRQTREAESRAARQLEAAYSAAIATSLEPAVAVAALARLQLADQSLAAVKQTTELVTTKLQLKYQCPNCSLSPSGEKLIKN